MAVPLTPGEEIQKAFGFIREIEFQVLKSLAQKLPPSPVVVNIGAGAGTSGLAFMESRDDLRLWTVDVENGNNPFGGLGNECDAFKTAGYSLGGRWIQVHGRSQDVTWFRGDPWIDLVFVDGDHSYEGVLGDIHAWLPRIRPGGIIVFHDSSEGWMPTVGRAIKENEDRLGEKFLAVELLQAFWVPGLKTEEPVRLAVGTLPGVLDFVSYYPAYKGYFNNFEVESTRWVQEHARQEWTALDSGAHVGYYTMILSTHLTKGKVYAFEPNPIAVEMLKRNILYNTRHNFRDFSNVRLTTDPLADQPGRRKERVYFTGQNSVDREFEFTTIDSFALGFPRLDFIKTDTDGWDLEVLRGAAGTVKKFRPIILAEINYALAWRGHTEAEAEALFEEWEYDHRVLDKENWLAWPWERKEAVEACRES